jgi:hemerythrin-like domain-containing protein
MTLFKKNTTKHLTFENNVVFLTDRSVINKFNNIKCHEQRNNTRISGSRKLRS